MGAARYKPYPAYKPSGVEWLGDIPEGWKASKIKYSTNFQVGWTPPTGVAENFVGENLWANISDLGAKWLSATEKQISDIAALKASMSITPAGSLLYSFKLSVGTVSFAARDMYTNEAIASFLVNDELPLAYLYYLAPIFIIQNASTNIYGARILNQELIRNADTLLPPRHEAAKIAAFLDFETGKIDALIAKQERLIDLLEEKRQAVISHAMTKGLNPNAPLRPSGIYWLGDVPEHWEVLPLNRIVREFVDYRGKTPTKIDEGVPLVTATQIKRGRVDHSLDPVFISHQEYRERMTRGFPATGDLLLTTEAPLGEVALVEDPMIATGQRIILMKCNSKYVVSNYLLRHFQSQFGKAELFVRSSGSTASGIRADRLRASRVAIPPVSEQKQIVKHIEDNISKFEKIEQDAASVVALLKERRTALISAAVTGKIDVRDWQPPQPLSDTDLSTETLQEAIA